MDRVWWTAAVGALLARPGCVQTGVAPTDDAPAEAPTDFPVQCSLLDEERLPLTEGTCIYRFGLLGATVEVDETGTVVRDVPAGAEGLLQGMAPGRSTVETPIVADKPLNVRFVL